MKKTKALSLLLAGLLFSGCGARTVPETTQVPATIPAGLEAPGEIKPIAPMPEPVVLQYRREERQAKDPETGTVLLTGQFTLPRIYLPGQFDAGRAINAVMNPLEEDFWLTYDSLLKEAGDRRAENPEAFQSYYLAEGGFFPRADKRIVTMVTAVDRYSGGAYGTSTQEGFVFDGKTGKRLTLDDLSGQPGLFRSTLLEAMVKLAEETPEIQEKIGFFGPMDYRTAFHGLLREGSWFLTETGLTVFSNEEELGPHAAGTVEFPIPYETLAPYFKAEYLPEPLVGAGTMSLNSAIGCNGRILDDLILQPEGPMLMLAAEGRVEKVLLSRTLREGEAFVPGEPLWEASFMEDCVLGLQAELSEQEPLMVTYTNQEGTAAYLLTQTGADAYTLKKI